MGNDGVFSMPLRVGMALLLAVALLVTAVPAVSLAAPSESANASDYYVYHTVRRGETLSQIAVRYGVTLHTLMKLNGIYNPNHIYVGQILKIPSGGGTPGCAFYHTVQYGQTLSGIAAYYGVNVHALAKANNVDHYSHIYAGQKLCVPGTGGPVDPHPQPVPEEGFYYIVRPGDTLSGIAHRFGTSVHAIMAANGISHSNRIYKGQKLFIPSYYVPPSPPPYHPPHPKPKPEPTPVPPPPVPEGPWTGLYYNNVGFGGSPVLVRQDAAVNFDWGQGSPAPSINSDNFSAIWTSTPYFHARTYRFYATSDDGVRVYIDDHLLIDGWSIHPAQGYFGDIYLSEGYHSVRVEYFEAEGMASIQVNWVEQ